MWTFSLLMFITFIIMGVTTGLTPFYSRQSTPFGIAIAEKHPFVEKKKKQFASWNILASILFGLPIFLFPLMSDSHQAETWSVTYTIAVITLLMLCSFILYLKLRNVVLEWKKSLPITQQVQAKKIIIDASYHENIHAKGNWSFFIWQVVIIVIPLLFAFAFYDRIPEMIPVQWNSQFEVSRTIEKSVWGVLALPVVQFLMIPVLNFSNYAIIQSKQKLSPLDPAGASEKSRYFRQIWSNYLFWLTIATQLLISGLFLYSLFGKGRFSWLLIATVVLYLLFVVGWGIYLTMKYGQAGEKLLTEEEQYYVDPDEEETWLFGMLYYNKEDPSVFVEKRFGVGVTLNFARWQSWLFMVGILLFTVLVIVWSFSIT